MIFRSALLFVVLGYAAGGQEGAQDPVFAAVPFEQWLAANDPPRFRWTTRVLPPELSNLQRLRARVEIQVDGEEVAKRRGKRQLVMLVQFNDSQGRAYQTHKAIDLEEIQETAGKMNFVYSQDAFVLPGEYRVSLGVFDSETGDHSVAQRMLHVNPLKNDPLPTAWRDLPPVEILRDSPDATQRLYLPVESHRPVRVDLLVNSFEQTEIVPALRVLSQLDIRNGSLNVVLLDLARQKVAFEQTAAHDLDWSRMEAAFKQADPKVIDVHSLEKRGRSAQFFVRQVGERLEVSGEPVRVVIVLTGPTAFDSGENLHPIELGAKPAGKLFYIRYHSPLPKPEFRPPFEEPPRFGRRQPLPLPRTGPGAALAEPVDALERTVKPLDPHLFDVYTPEQFRKTLSTIIDEISRL